MKQLFHGLQTLHADINHFALNVLSQDIVLFSGTGSLFPDDGKVCSRLKVAEINLCSFLNAL